MTVKEWKQFLSDKEDCRTVYYDHQIMDISKLGLGCEHISQKTEEQGELFK